jgi:superfamily II DNA or RNA helicase/HKD family nuclease
MTSVVNLPGERRMLDVVREGLSWAGEARLAVSFTRCSGLGLLIDPLKELIARKGDVTLLTSTYMNVTQPEALRTLARLDGLRVFVQDGSTGFHSKFWFFGGQARNECWVGSSNLTKGGLSENIEWNICASDLVTLAAARHQFDALIHRPDVRPLDSALIEAYALRYSEQQRSFALPLTAEPEQFMVTPNAAQREALEKIKELYARGVRRAAVIAATGIGKTYLAAFAALELGAKSVLFVSHRKEHLTQASRTFERVLPPQVRAVFATIQSIARSPNLLDQHWDLLVIDEFHHAEAPSYERLRPVRDRTGTFLLGLTATPERTDGKDVLEWCDWNVAYEVRLAEAIERRWLLPFHYFAVADETVDFADFNWRKVIGTELEEALSIPARVALIHKQALSYGFDGPKRATVGFCAGVKHAEFMAAQFNARGEVAAAVVGSQSVEEREALYRHLEDPANPLTWLFVADVLNEGVDIPAINSLLFLRPTESPTVFLQQLGRGLRLTPGCEVLTVLDFVGHHQRAWVALNAINGVANTGHAVRVGTQTIRPPGACEVVLQRRTVEVLEKISRHTSRRQACEIAYEEVKHENGIVRPIDFFGRAGSPHFTDFRDVYGDWVQCLAANGDAPAWAATVSQATLPRRFLQSLERNWQQQRVHAWATVWGLANGRPNLGEAYDSFFERFPQWAPERRFDQAQILKTLEAKLAPGSLLDGRLAPEIVSSLGDSLGREVEERLLGWLATSFDERYGGVLKTPAELQLHRMYRRPEVVRHFGVRFDPALHNVGALTFGRHVALIAGLSREGSNQRHRYANRFIDERHFGWSSQNKMSRDNSAGQLITRHRFEGRSVHLFVQADSHSLACYLGLLDFVHAENDKPMFVTFELRQPVSEELRHRLET